jgi:hypothetical protein
MLCRKPSRLRVGRKDLFDIQPFKASTGDHFMKSGLLAVLILGYKPVGERAS